jgi:hypothetical protein
MTLLRALCCAFAAVVIAGPAQAEPLLLTFRGTIPELTVSTEVTVLSASGTTTQTSTQTLSNVAVTGRATFDSGVWNLTQPPVAPDFPLREFVEVDPQDGPLPVGVETSERVRARLEVGSGIGALDFDRDILNNLTPGAVAPLPYRGRSTFGYVEGSEAVSFETGDAFYVGAESSFSWGNFVDPGGPAGELLAESQFQQLFVGIFSFYDQNLALNNIFGPGAPVDFSWIDPVPGNCLDANAQATCVDGTGTLYGSFGHFFSNVTRGSTPDTLEYRSTSYQGTMVWDEMRLRAVPEPASLLLTGVAFSGVALARRRRTKTLP